MVLRALLAKIARLGVFIGSSVMVAGVIGVIPSAHADGSCPPGFAMATVIGSHGAQACAPVGSITSWGAVEPGALITLPGTTSYHDQHAPLPYGDGGWPGGYPPGYGMMPSIGCPYGPAPC